MPDIILEDDLKHVYYGLKDGSDFSGFKIGLHEKRNLRVVLDYFRNRFEHNVVKADGTKNNFEISSAKPWFYSFAKDNQFNYSTGNNGVHYCYGFTGTGFKFLPLHGKIVYEKLLKGKSKQITIDMLKECITYPKKSPKLFKAKI